MTDADGTTNYSYNYDGQLTGASGSALASSESYSYDANGNRTNSGDTTTTNNELTSDGTYDYTYDADGNLITQTTIATGATENFTWDYRNRLTEITYKTAGGTTTETVQYTYNALNQRISQTVTNGSGDVTLAENYIYDGSNLVMVLNSSGNVTHSYLYGPGANQVLADDAGSGNVTWMLADEEGSVRDVINSSGTVLDRIVYDAYGNILSQTSPSNQPRFAFAGMQLDQTTGLYYDNARYYDSSTGQFISQDPSGFIGANTNLYGYVNNDPINLVDPFGLDPYNISTLGMSNAERESIIQYAQRTNAWLAANGPVTVQPTAGTLRSQAGAAARRERIRSAQAGEPYTGQAGHVPDTALTGMAEPPGGWLNRGARFRDIE
jgi:RHS repeat-associated protein